MAEGLLGVVCAHVGHCRGHLSSLGLPAGGPGASTSCRDSRPGVGAAAGFLVQGVPDHHIAGCCIQLKCSPKYQRLTLKCCSAMSPRMLCRALAHRQQHGHSQTPRRFGIYQAAGAGACFWLCSVCFLFPLPVPSGVAQHVSAWPAQQHLCSSGPLSQGQRLSRGWQPASGSRMGGHGYPHC